MSAHADNLGRAARILKRLADLEGPAQFEGVRLKDIIGDVLAAQNAAYMAAAVDRTFACNVDESAGMADVVELQGYSRKVICE